MPGEQCPLPDCRIPIERPIARRTEVISHLRDVHKVELTKGQGGNEATKRKKHGEQFRAWLIQNNYDADLDKFFTAIDDGLASRPGASTDTQTSMTTGSAEKASTAGIGPSRPLQGESGNSWILQSISSQSDNAEATGSQYLQYEFVEVDKTRRVSQVDHPGCVFCLKESQKQGHIRDQHTEALSTLDEMLAHYTRYHDQFTFEVEKDDSGPAEGKKVVRIVFEPAETKE